MNKLLPQKPALKIKIPEKKATPSAKKRKAKIPAAVYEAIWIQKMGRVFEGKCLTTWCPNIITVFDYQAGHDIPESKGGPPTVENLFPICSRCNQSMGDRYTFKEWCAQHSIPSVTEVKSPAKKSWWKCF